MAKIDHHERIIFKKSYLKRINSILAFDKFKCDEQQRESIKQELKRKGFTIAETGVLPMIQAQKGELYVIYSEKGLAVTCDKVSYASFESHLEFLKELIALSGVITINSIVFQKQNIYRINKGKVSEVLTKDRVLATLFNTQLVGSEPAFGQIEDGCYYTIQNKYNEDSEKILVELIVSGMLLQGISVEAFVQTISTMNQRMYDYWFEAVSDKVRETMNKD
jgi:hypothetical protein